MVIGGGVAGLSAAATLLGAGLSVRLLEARDRLGGRVLSEEHGDGVLEKGAQWIHGGCHGNCMFNLAALHNLLGEKVKLFEHELKKDNIPGYFYTSSGRVIKEVVSDIAWDIFEEIDNECQDYLSNINLESIDTTVSLKQFYWDLVKAKIKNHGPLKPSAEDDVLLCLASLSTSVAEYIGDDLNKTSLALYGTCRELPGGQVIIPGGLNTIVDAIADTIPAEVIKLNEKVVNIDWGADKLTITTETSVFFSDHVIVTVPLGVLKKSHMALFTPNLGEDKIRAITNMGEGSLSKIFLEWEQPWWMPGYGGLLLAWSKEELESAELPAQWYRYIFNFSPVEGQHNVLLFWVVGQAAAVVDRKPDHEIVDTIGWLLRKFTADPALPYPARVMRHCWTTDPLTRGVFSYPSTRSHLTDITRLSAPLPSCDQPRLLLAGEHTHQHYWAFLHGARLAGIEQAERVINYMNSK